MGSYGPMGWVQEGKLSRAHEKPLRGTGSSKRERRRIFVPLGANVLIDVPWPINPREDSLLFCRGAEA